MPCVRRVTQGAYWKCTARSLLAALSGSTAALKRTQISSTISRGRRRSTNPQGTSGTWEPLIALARTACRFPVPGSVKRSAQTARNPVSASPKIA